MTGSLLDSFAGAVARYGDRTAIVEADGSRVSFAELAERSGAFASAWQARGLGRGDRLLMAMPVSADLYAALAALWSLGATAVLPEPAMGLGGVRHALKLVACKGLVASGGYRWLRWLLPGLWFKSLFQPSESVGEFERSAPWSDDIALISFTSGSTGLPKAIARSHGFMTAQQDAISPLLESAEEEVDLVAFPVFVLINLAAGRTSVLPNWRMNRAELLEPDALAGWIESQNVTRALLPPAICETLAQAGHLEQLRTVFTGGGPVFPDIVQRLQSAHPGLRVVSVYGSTEAEPIAHLEASDVTRADLDDMASGAGLLAGHPVPQVRVRILEDEILVAGEHVNKGYLDPSRDAETKLREEAIVWHRTGDAGRFDAQGRLWLLGRVGKDVAGRFPFEIETAARFWPGVRGPALAQANCQPVLAIEGDRARLDEWRTKAAALGIPDVRWIDKIPMDRRHRSKVDYPALLKALER